MRLVLAGVAVLDINVDGAMQRAMGAEGAGAGRIVFEIDVSGDGLWHGPLPQEMYGVVVSSFSGLYHTT